MIFFFVRQMKSKNKKEKRYRQQTEHNLSSCRIELKVELQRDT